MIAWICLSVALSGFDRYAVTGSPAARMIAKVSMVTPSSTGISSNRRLTTYVRSCSQNHPWGTAG